MCVAVALTRPRAAGHSGCPSCWLLRGSPVRGASLTGSASGAPFPPQAPPPRGLRPLPHGGRRTRLLERGPGPEPRLLVCRCGAPVHARDPGPAPAEALPVTPSPCALEVPQLDAAVAVKAFLSMHAQQTGRLLPSGAC